MTARTYYNCPECEQRIDRIAELERQLSTARADALREAAEACERYAETDYVGFLCVGAIRALIPPQEV